jgi:hypothetical protein
LHDSGNRAPSISVTSRIDAGLLRTLVEEKRDRRLAELACAYEERTSGKTLQSQVICVNAFCSHAGGTHVRPSLAHSIRSPLETKAGGVRVRGNIPASCGDSSLGAAWPVPRAPSTVSDAKRVCCLLPYLVERHASRGHSVPR